MNEILWAAAVGAAFGAGIWLGQRWMVWALARAAVQNPLQFLAMAQDIVARSKRTQL